MMRDAGSYAYARACGIIGKSFLGKRISALAGLHTLSELDRLIFPGLQKELPGRELLVDLEHRIVERSVRQILSILNSYRQPPRLLTLMLKAYEYTDIKACFQQFIGGKKNILPVSDIGRFKTVHFEMFPDFAAMLNKTEYNFILRDLKSMQGPGGDFSYIETKLDRHFYMDLMESLYHIPEHEREEAQKLLIHEISLRNCVWAFRLRSYYQKSPQETAKYLMDIKPRAGSLKRNASLAREAYQSLEFGMDSRQQWNGWKWERFLNPEESNGQWAANPRYFQNAASQYIYRRAMHSFHKSPTTIGAIFCFIKLKQFEEDILTSVAEGLALGMDGAGVFKMLEVKK